MKDNLTEREMFEYVSALYHTMRKEYAGDA